jgi:hypothetical protein
MDVHKQLAIGDIQVGRIQIVQFDAYAEVSTIPDVIIRTVSQRLLGHTSNVLTIMFSCDSRNRYERVIGVMPLHHSSQDIFRTDKNFY